MYFIGVDGGGTKTKFTLSNEKLESIVTITKRASNINEVGSAVLAEILTEGLDELLKKGAVSIEDISYAAFGLAGYGNIKELAKELRKVVAKVYQNDRYILCNDVRIALEGALEGQSGINITAGTGSIALALDDTGEIHRCGGWGYRLGDEGSAYWIGLQVLRSFTMQVDGRMDKTHIYSMVKKKLNIDNDYDVIKYVNEIQGNRTIIATFSKICYEAAKLKDNVALEIFDKAAEELSRLAKGLERYFNPNSIIKVSYTGGVFNSGDFILEPLRRELKNDRFELVRPAHEPDIGACLLAKNTYRTLMEESKSENISM